MSWQTQVKGDPVAWLLEPEEPAIRHLALRDLLDRPADDPELVAVRQAAHRSGPIATILDAMEPEGCWARPGPGYNPKYRSTVWSLIALGQMGASVTEDARLDRACAYLLDHALTPDGRFSMQGPGAPSGAIDCLQGNLCAALLDLGCEDPRLEAAVDWMARSVTGEGIAPRDDHTAPLRYYASGNCGPLFACSANNRESCAWGGVKVMLALGKWPIERRTPFVEQAIAAGVAFLFSTDPVQAGYPMRVPGKPNRSWWQFGFPVFYVTDVLQNAEALATLGFGQDPRLANTLAYIRDKQDEAGRWKFEYSYAGKTWVDVGDKKQPSKWVTLRALRVLKAAG